MNGHPSVGRDAMGAMSPDTDAALLDAAADMLAALEETIADVDLAELDGVAPAVSFDPGAVPRTWRPVPLPPAPPAPAPDPPAEGEVPWTPAADLAALVRAGVMSPAQVARAYAARIERLEPALNAFVTVTLNETVALDERRTPAPTGRLAGVPVGLKDIFDTAGVATTCGSRILADRVPARDAEAWVRLRRDGAVLAGKLNTHEFAAGGTSENDHYGPVRNPWDTDRIAGGSSGGSAAAVAAATVSAALGSDTGGSIRIPAGCCGTVGLKPTYGLVSTAGVYPLSWTLDTVGPLARTVRDASLLLEVLADVAAEPAARAGAAHGLSGIRVGVPRAWLADVQPAVAARFDEAVADLRRCGAEVVEVRLPDLELMIAVNRVIQYAESSAWHEPLLRTRPDYGPAIRTRMEAGRFVLAGQYLTAQRLRAAACRGFAAAWRDADLVAFPTLPCTAQPIGGGPVDLGGRTAAVRDAVVRLTAPINVTGLPAITVPCGFGDDGMPVGLQLVAPPYAEGLLCFAAAGYEAATPVHRRRPDLAA